MNRTDERTPMSINDIGHVHQELSDGPFVSPVFQAQDALCRLPDVLFPERRYMYWSLFPMSKRRVTVISSRIGRRYERRGAWFDRMHRILTCSSRSNGYVINCPGSTSDRILQHVQATFDCNMVTCQLPDQPLKFNEWLRGIAEYADSRTDRCSVRIALSPALEEPCPHPMASLPLSDRLLAALGEDVYVLHVRKGGAVHRIIDAWSGQNTSWTQRWLLAMGSSLVSTTVAERWLNHWATAWYSLDPSNLRIESDKRSTAIKAVDHSARVIELDQVRDVDRYLSHWTRRQAGPWPDETSADFIGCLLREPDARSRCAMSALTRIVSMRRLIATRWLTRSASPVVCLTGCPLTSFSERRVFRPAHARWDFEPFGICIDRQWLVRRGARQVIYGNNGVWERLDPSDRPFFQFQRTMPPDVVACDWSREQEWRHVGDLDLRHLPADMGFVFVPDSEDALRLQQLSPWPVVVLPRRR